MASQDEQGPAEDPPAGRAVCGRARGCPGWFVTEDVYVQRCGTCRMLATDEQARESALAAGLDVQRSGYVAGVSGVIGGPHEVGSAEQRATASVNGLLKAALDQLQDAQRVAHVPPPLRSCVDQLVVDIARAQGVSEWLSEEIVRLVEEAEDAQG